MPTRGERYLKTYLGKETPVLVSRQKRAREVVPVLQARGRAEEILANPAKSATDLKTSYNEKGVAGNATNRGETPDRSGTISARKQLLGHRQRCLVEALLRPTAQGLPAHSAIVVKRTKLEDMQRLIDVLSEASVSRAASFSVSSGNASPEEESRAAATAVLVLVEEPTIAAAMQEKLQQCGAPLEVALLSQLGDARRWAECSDPPTAPSPTPKAKKAKQPRPAGATKGTVTPTKGKILMATPHDLLKADAAKGWCELVGALVVVLAQPATAACALAQQPSIVAHLAAVRWHDMGHIRTTCIVSLQGERLAVAAALNGLTTPPSALSSPTAPLEPTKEAKPLFPRTIHYCVATGIDRFGFLISLVKGLRPRQGLVVHFATKEGCGFMYDVLYHFMYHQKELPAHVALLTDYEGESAYTSASSTAQRDLLGRRFDQIVQDAAKASVATPTTPTAVVLLSCFGLVPSSGTIFLSYDIVPDVPNFGQFVRKALDPSARCAVVDSKVCANEKRSHWGERSDALVRPQSKARRAESGGDPSASPLVEGRTAGKAEQSVGVALQEPATYRHIFLLLRPNEVKGVLRHVRLTGEGLNLTYTPLARRPSQATYHLAAEKLKSLNKKLFPIQNLAFLAYKTTMKAYSAVGPRDVYDEKQLNLEKAAEEFGFTELPLLDLRLKENNFRPKEDLYKLSRKKQVEERRAYKRFAEKSIPIDP